MRLPVCPQPKTMESWRSWLSRVASHYGSQSSSSFLRSILPNHPYKAIFTHVSDSLTIYCPDWILANLSLSTGNPKERLSQLTLAHWVPPLQTPDQQVSFERYIDAFRCLPIPPIEARHRYFGDFTGVEPPVPWLPQNDWDGGLSCQHCQASEAYEQLVWPFGMTSTRPWHRTDLYWDWGRAPGFLTADWFTCMALRHGEIPLPDGRTESAQWWFRLLRSLIHEISFPEWYLLADNTFAAPSERIWNSPEGIPKFQKGQRLLPNAFEALGYLERRRYLRAASVALDMFMEGTLLAPEGSESRKFMQSGGRV